MKKRFAALLLAVCMLMTCMPASAFTLPSVLTEIEDEAFRGDGSLNGVVTLPDGVTRVGDNAFTGTGLYALIVPEGTAYVGPQAMAQAAYVRVNGAATQVGALSGVKCVLAPEGSSALTAAEAAGADAVPLAQLVAEGGFLYHAQDGAVTLLCAADVASVGASVEIPAEVDGLPVTAISGYAFIGCTGLEAITLPIAVKPTVTTDATADCPAAVITYAGEQIEPEEVIVNSVTANVTAGASGNSITWSVDAQVGEGGSYAYTVERNGSAVLTTESDEATFVYEAEDAGAYRLLVTVTSRGGVSATGVSAVLYIAVEALELTVPETLQTGENLPITIGEAANAQGYTLYVTDEATGALVVKRTLTAAQDVTVDGYLLPAGEYRVSGYVHGNDYRYTVPTVRNVTVSGALAAGPAVPAQEPMLVNSYRAVTLAENNPFVIRYQLRCADGTLTEPVTLPSAAKGSPAVHTAYIYAYETAYQSGGVILVQAAMYADGLWTDWGAVTEVALNTMPALTAPTVTCPETVRAGADFTVAFTEVENATWYNLDFVNDETGESWNYNGYSKCQSLYISGASFVLPAGSYTVRVEVSADGYTGAKGTAKLTITGTRPAAPDVAVDIDVFYLNENLMTITVTATGYESACVGSDACVQPALHRFNTEQISLTNGVGSRTWNVGLGEFADGWYYAGYAFVYADGVWSDPGVVYIPIRKPEPLAGAVITAPETLSTGADLTFSFAAVEGAESYDAYLCSTAGSDGSCIRLFPGVQPEVVLTHEGYDLPSGSYYVEVKASSTARGTSSSKHYFTVTGTRPAAPAVACDADDVWVGATAAFTIEGADGVPVHVSWSSSDGGSGTCTGVGPAWQYTFPSSRSGDTMTFRFSVKQNGLWSQWAVAEMTVLAEKPMDKPVITCPDTVQAGTDVIIGFGAVEDAESYRVQIHEGYTGGVIPSGATGRVYRGYFSAGETCCVSGGVYDLSAGEYTVVVRATRADNTFSEAAACLTVTGTRPAAPQLTLDTDVYYTTGTSFTATVTAPGCETAAVSSYVLDAAGEVYQSRTGTEVTLGSNGTGTAELGWGELPGTDYSVRVSASVLTDGVWSAFASVTLPVMEREPIGPAVITAPDTVQNGADAVIRFAPVENAETYDINVCSTLSGAAVYYVGAARPDTDYTVPGHVMAAGSYRIVVSAGSEEFGSSSAEKLLTVTGTRPAAPAVTCVADEPWVDGVMRFTVAAEDVEAVYGEVVTTDLGSSALTGSGADWSFTIPGWYNEQTVTFRFSVKQDGLWSQWATIEREILETKPLQAPTLTSPATIAAGQDLSVTIGGAEDAEYYTLRVYAGYTGDVIPSGSWIISTGVSEPGTAVLQGHELLLEAGEYTLVAIAYYSGGSTSCAARLTVTGTRPAAPTVSVDKTTVLPYENFAFTIGTAGAELARYRAEYGNGSASNGSITVLEDVTVWETYESQEYDYSYTFCTCQNGVWSDWSEPIVVTVANTLPGPEITLQDSVSLGCDVAVTAAAVPGATKYCAQVYNAHGLEVATRTLTDAEGGDLLFEGYLFAAGSYTMKVQAHNGTGWSNVTEKTFTVVSGDRPQAPAAVADTDTGRISVSYGFTIPAEGAEKAAVRCYRVGDTDKVTYRNLEVTADALRWTDMKYSAGDTWNYAFAVQVDGVWSPFGTALPVTITARAQLDEVVIACPETAQAGAEVVFTFAAVENADSYSVTLLRPDGTTRSFTGYPDNEMTLPGYDLNPGVYTLRITVSGASCDSSTAECTFTVTGTRSAAPATLVDKTTVFTGESYTFAIDGGDCDLIAWRYTTDAGGSNSGTLNVLTDVTVWETSASWAGVQSYSFCCLSDGLWSAWSEPITVTISQRPAMPEPVVTLPDTAQKGTDLTVAFAGVEGADDYYVYLYTIYGQQIASRYLTEAGSVTFAGCILPDSYVRVQVSARSTEGGRSTSTATLRVLDAALPAAPAVTGPADGLVQTETRAVFTVATPGADQAAVRRYRVGDPNNVTVTTFAVTGDETRWSEYRYDTGSTWAYAFSVQKDGVWSAWSSELRVAVVEQLPLAAPVITCAESFLAGEDIAFSYTPVDGAAGYWWTLQRDGAMLDNNNDGVNPTALAATIPGWYEYLSAGAYRLKVTAYTDDGETSQSEHAFTITGTRPAAPAVTCDANAWVGGSASFTIDAEGAEATRSGLKQADGTLMILSESTEWAYSFTEAEAGETLTFCFFTKADGLWTAWAEVSLTVLAEQPLAAPEVTAPASLRCGEDLEYLFNAVQGAVSYTVTLRRPDGTIDPLRDTDKEPGNWYSVTGFKMGVGEYTLIVTAIAEDGRTSATEKTFTVSGTMPAAPTVTVDKQVIAVGECPTFTIDTTGAEAFYMDAHGAGLGTGPYWVLDDEMQWTTPYSPASGTTIGFRVKIDGVWSLMSEPIVITVTDAMPAPALTLPESVEQGIDITITIGAVTGAKGYDILVMDPAGLRGWSEYLSAPGSTTLYGCILEPGVHTVQAYAYDANYRPGESASAVFTVTAPTGTRPDAPAVTASVTEAGKGDDVVFTIDAAGADMMVVRYSSYTGSPRVIDSSAGTIAWTESFYAADQETYSFAVRVNGVWSSYSEPITVRSAAGDGLSGPLVSLPDTHAEGQDLYVHFTKVENATRYRAFLHDPSGAWVCDQTVFSDDSAVFSFPGYYFITLGRYSIRVRSEGSDVSSDFIRTYFTVVSGDRPAAPAVTADAEYSLVNAKHGFTIDTAGAERAAVRYILSNDQAYVNVQELTVTGDSLYWTNQLYDSSAGMTVKYLFSVCVDGVWSPWSAAKTVRIVDALPKGAPVITCAESFLAGEDITFSVEAPADAVSCQWRISCDGTEFVGEVPANGAVTLSALEHMYPAPDSGLLTVTAVFEDGGTTQAEHTFDITGTRQDAPAVTAERNRVALGEQVALTVSAPGASQVCLLIDITGERILLEPAEGIASYMFVPAAVGDYGFTASACYGTQWTYWSNRIVNVSVTEPLYPPVFAEWASVNAGEDVTIAFSGVGETANCWVQLTDEGGSLIAESILTGPECEITIPGYHFLPGEYTVTAYASARGETVSSTGVRTVCENSQRPAAPVICSDLRAELDRVTMTFTAEGAENAYDFAAEFCTVVGSSYQAFSSDGPEWSYCCSDSPECMICRFAVYENGLWSAWTVIELSYVDGVLQGMPEVQCKSTFLEGEDFTFCVAPLEGAEEYTYQYNTPYCTIEGTLDSELTGMFEGCAGYEEAKPTDSGLLTVTARMANGDTRTTVHPFIIEEAERPAPPVVQLERTTVQLGSPIVCSAEFTGETKVYTKVDGYMYLMFVGEGLNRWEFNHPYLGEFECTFCAYVDGRWSEWSDPVIVTVTDDLPAPCVTFPETATEACDLTLTIESNSDADCFVATVYTAESEEFVCRRTLNAAAGDLVIPGCYISGGVAYQISLKASNAGGKTSYAGTQLTAAACDQARPAAPNVTCSSTGASAGDTLTLTVDTAGADAVWADLCTSWGGSYDPLSGDAPEYTYTVGEHEECLLFRFSVQVDGVWSAWTEVDVERLFE